MGVGVLEAQRFSVLCSEARPREARGTPFPMRLPLPPRGDHWCWGHRQEEARLERPASEEASVCVEASTHSTAQSPHSAHPPIPIA